MDLRKPVSPVVAVVVIIVVLIVLFAVWWVIYGRPREVPRPVMPAEKKPIMAPEAPVKPTLPGGVPGLKMTPEMKAKMKAKIFPPKGEPLPGP